MSVSIVSGPDQPVEPYVHIVCHNLICPILDILSDHRPKNSKLLEVEEDNNIL